MLFGNRDRFAIQVRPLAPSWDRRYRPEQTAWGALTFWVEGTNVCLHADPGTEVLDEAIKVPLAPLADWLVRSWLGLAFEERARVFPTADSLHDVLMRWGRVRAPSSISDDAWVDAREEWWSRHFLSAGADGALVPNLAFARHDEALVVQWTRPSFPCEGPIFVSPEGLVRVPWADGEDVLAAFVAFVAEWLRADGGSKVYPWVASPDPLRDMPGSVETALELYTGRSTDELCRLTGASNLPDLLSLLDLPETAKDPAASPLTQVLRDLPLQLPEGIGDALSELRSVTERSGARHLMPLREAALDAARASTGPEEAGQLAARTVRKELDLNGRPIEDAAGLLTRLGVALLPSEIRDATRMIAGMRTEGQAAVMLFQSPRTTVPWGRRFEMARALGHFLLDPSRGNAVGAASSSFAPGSRRRRSGAFAAELLLPVSALTAESGGVLDRAAELAIFQQILSRYRVGARVAAYQLWNHGFLSSPEARDDLIEEFAAQAP